MNEQITTRRSARAELASLTEDRILRGLAALLVRGDEVTFERLAVETEVPQRTLYRYFANREALFSTFWRWVNETIEIPSRPNSPEEVVAHIPELFAAFDRDEPLVRAMLHNAYGRAVRLDNAEARREKFQLALATITNDLSEEEARSLLVAVTVLCSATGWESIKDNWGLTGPAAADAAQRAVRSLIDGARGRSGAGST
jgi:AcrR family transcriptional regulator